MKLVWYNRPRKFNNGITWVRIGHGGLGLWWQRKPFRVRILWPERSAA